MEAESSKLSAAQRVSGALRSLTRPASRDAHMKTASRDSAHQRFLGAGVHACQACFVLGCSQRILIASFGGVPY